MDNFALVKAAVDITEYIGRTVEWTREGRTCQGFCPFHENPASSKTPSFGLYEIDGETKWKCYSSDCGSGDVFDFVVKIGTAESNVEAMKILAKEYHVDISDEQPSKHVKDIQSLKRAVMVYTQKALLTNEKAMAFLKDKRGITKAMVVKWKIGLSDGNLHKTFGKLYDEELIAKSGISLATFNMLMYPVFVKSAISHWDLRECVTKPDKKHQMKSDAREGGMLYNMKVLSCKEVWGVEGRDDVILMSDVADLPTFGFFGPPNSEQIQYLKDVCEFAEHVPDAVSKKTLHLLMDPDSAGAQFMENMANELSPFYNVVIHMLPKGLDPHKFILTHGSVHDLPVRTSTKNTSRIVEKDNMYFYRNAEGELRRVTDFAFQLDYEIVDDKLKKRYLVKIYQGDTVEGPYEIDSKAWASEPQFITWLGSYGGKYNIWGGKREIQEIKRYMFEKLRPKQIRMYDTFGTIAPNVSLFDNGCIVDGNIRYANDMGVTWVKAHGLEGVKTVTWHHGKQIRIPEHPISLPEIIDNCVKHLKTSTRLWTVLGFATYCVYFKPITQKHGIAPLALFSGQSVTGKSMTADIVQSLTGGFDIPKPNKDTTNNAFNAESHKYAGFLIIQNELGEKNRDSMIRSWFDMNPKGKRRTTNDNQTYFTEFNCPAIFTSKQSPAADDVLNRLIILEFLERFDNKTSRDTGFMDWYRRGVQEGGNATFMHELLKTDLDKTIVGTIDTVYKAFSKHGLVTNSRQTRTVSIIAGCFVAAKNALGLDDMIRDAGGKVPSQAEMMSVFGGLARVGEDLIKAHDDMHKFFSFVQQLYQSGLGEYTIKLEKRAEGKEGRWYMVVHLRGLFGDVKRAMSYERDTFTQKITYLSVSKYIKDDLGAIKPHSGRIGKKLNQLHWIPLDALEERTGFKFESGEEGGPGYDYKEPVNEQSTE